MERLKQALSGLSQLTYPSGSPGRRQSQLIDTLQSQVKALQQQLAVSTLAWEGFVLYVRGRVRLLVKVYVEPGLIRGCAEIQERNHFCQKLLTPVAVVYLVPTMCQALH